MHIVRESARVKVPATSGNLGPGFDAMGMAHDLWDEVAVTLTTGKDRAVVLGEGHGTLPKDENHLIIRVIKDLMQRFGLPNSGIELVCKNNIPQGRGLGSSAAATVAGVMLVRALVGAPEEFSLAQVLRLATDYEGHPDNAAPCIYGGATLSWGVDETLDTVSLPVNSGVKTTLLIPDFELPTTVARSVLPETVPHVDAVFNSTRTAMLTHALEHRPDLLFRATEDRLHQNYRAESLRESASLLQALRKAGWPAVISGAGPTILLFASVNEAFEKAISAQGFKVLASQQVTGAKVLDA